jgi:large subunit ribosomal protein L13e
MVKGNQIIPNQHFRKHWFMRVRTWFNQPARKDRRRRARIAKATAVFPRPVGLLRPAVHAQTVRYNNKVRLGRGFSLAELKAAGMTQLQARQVGIAVDHRRRNLSVEGRDANIERLKAYKSKLVVFKKGAKQDEIAKSQQPSGTVVMPLSKPKKTVEARSISADEKKLDAYATLRKLRADVRLVGVRQKLKEKKGKKDE